MGLDMYLSKRTYVKNWKHTKPEHKHEIIVKKAGKPTHVKPERIAEISEDVAYWRKANQIHNWFVKNVQNGVDNCGHYHVSREQLKELVETCEKVLAASKLVKGKVKNGETLKDGEWIPVMEDGKLIKDSSVAQELLPTGSGFFFGSTEYNEYYVQDLKETIEQVNAILAEGEDSGDFYYHSSW